MCKFADYDSLYREHVLQPNVLIITNVEGLKLKHWELNKCIGCGKSTEATKEQLEKFFSIDNFEKIMEKTGKNHIILVIDEAHEYFPEGFKSNPIYNFFAYHGHIGLDIILMTQGLDRMSKMFNPLLENIINVVPRSKAVFKQFTYHFTDLKGKFLYSDTLRKKDTVFAAYKSYRKDEAVKPKNALNRWFIIIAVLFLSAGLLFKSALAIVKGKAEKGKSAASQVQKPAPAPAITAPIPTPAPVPPPYPSIDSAPLPVATPVATPPPPTLKPITSVQVAGFAPVFGADRKPLTVIGVLENGSKRRYLLSTGQLASLKRRYYVGDEVVP
jgi:hypothetical protein